MPENETAVYETTSLGYDLKFRGPKTEEDYDRAAGKVGACLEDAIDNTIYRGTLPEWQEPFAKRIEELTGQKRQVNQEATDAAKKRSKNPEKVKDVMETVRVFHNRVTAGMSDEDKKALAAIAQEVADGITVDPSPSKRQGGLRKDLKSKAESLLTLPTDQLEAKVTSYLDYIEGYELDRDEANKPTVESLGRLIGQVLEKKMSEL
jgi:hypothetical protein